MPFASGDAVQPVAADNPAAEASGVTSRRRLGGGLAAERRTVRRLPTFTTENPGPTPSPG
jgi:hypothetical protein